MSKRKKKAGKRKPKAKNANKVLGQSILWEGEAYVITKAYTVNDAIHEKLELTAIRFKPIEF